MGDLISRQAAIDALHMHLMYRMGTDSNKKRLDDWINSLPSAQPDVPDICVGDMISRQTAISAICNACGKIDCDKMDKCEKLQLPPANSSEIPNNSDTISRQAAIDALYSVDEYNARSVKAIKELPSAQPKRGRWIGKYPVTSVCSECGFLIHDSKVKAFAYCPNCGAKMRGEQNGRLNQQAGGD